MFVRNGTVTPGPSRKCDITFFVKLIRDDQNLRNNCVTVPWRRAGRRASPCRHPACHANVVPPGSGPPPSKLADQFSSVLLRFVHGTVRAVFGPEGSALERVLRGKGRFRFRFLKNGSHGSGSSVLGSEKGSFGKGVFA